jgi:hypothetical protein
VSDWSQSAICGSSHYTIPARFCSHVSYRPSCVRGVLVIVNNNVIISRVLLVTDFIIMSIQCCPLYKYRSRVTCGVIYGERVQLYDIAPKRKMNTEIPPNRFSSATSFLILEYDDERIQRTVYRYPVNDE